MAVNDRVGSYLRFEALMMHLDDIGDPQADAIRDRFLEPLWRAMPAHERGVLNARGDLVASSPQLLSPRAPTMSRETNRGLGTIAPLSPRIDTRYVERNAPLVTEAA